MKHNGNLLSGVTDAADVTAGRGLGWASIAVGLTELFATRQLQQMIGVGGAKTAGILRILGVRELMHGVDILSHDDPTPGVWSRVAGDALDGALLGAAATRTRNPYGLATAALAVLPLVVLDLIFARRLSR